ncbi:MAG: metallophosphoesterase family protein [Planctomycetales bacterium]|nr:metallophosphoesterase family protein [Planctomycetales bacterium]
MKRAILSDIHGNLEALEAVLRDIESNHVDEIICLGDVIGYGPDPCACLDHAMSFSVTILGNHDNGALFDPNGFSSGAERAIFWTRHQLESPVWPEEDRMRRMDFICEMPRCRREEEFLFVHGSARNPLNEYVFPDDVYNVRKIEKLFGMIERYCFQGHTHVPGVFTDRKDFKSPAQLNYRYELGEHKAMINVGSVGQPRDSDPRSSYVILDDGVVEFRRVEYPLQKTAQKIYDIPDLDNFLGERLVEGR